MKLACITQSPEISNEELLMLENELLRDELKLREIENSLEIYECILDCIEKTGKVDKSLEVMFGENVSSTETFESEIKAQYESACEGFLDFFKKIPENIKEGTMFVPQAKKAKDLIDRAKKVMTDIHFPINIPLRGISASLRATVLMIQHGAQHDAAKEDSKGNLKIQRAVGSALIGESNLSKFIREEEGYAFRVFIANPAELADVLESMAKHGRLAIDEGYIKRFLDKVKSNAGVDAEYWAGYDDEKIKRLKNILLRGLVTTNMQVLSAIDAAISVAEKK